MNKTCSILNLFFCCMALSAFGQSTNESDAVGVWISENLNEKVEVYKRGDKYYGKMVWLINDYDENGNRQLDSKNPDPALQDRPMVGIEFITGYTYVGGGYYTGGRIYDMASGNTYRGRIYMPDENTAEIRGYIGIPLFGRTEVCTKVIEEVQEKQVEKLEK